MDQATNWLEQEQLRPYHKVASLFPLMEGPEFEALKTDIQANGLIEPIWLHPDGSIIDGRNRHRACLDAEIEPKFRTWDNHGSLVVFVVSLNLKRRDLNSGQRAVIALSVLPMLEEEAKERQRLAGGDRTSKYAEALTSTLTGALQDKGEAREQAAKLFGTSAGYMSYAKHLQEEAPDLLEEVRTATSTMPKAMRELTKRQRQDVPPLPSDKYRVLYADPPWTYNDSGTVGNAQGETDNYGRVGRHYPSMTIKELCALGDDVKEMAEDNAVLFLWATSPLLEDGFKVIKAWGFKYKTSFVWDKVKHNYGHYNSVRHEFLLICTRGSCTPDVSKLFDSVQTIERSDRHSEKPEEFRTIIDTLYTRGKRIELFARTKAEGWEIWGNEPTTN